MAILDAGIDVETADCLADVSNCDHGTYVAGSAAGDATGLATAPGNGVPVVGHSGQASELVRRRGSGARQSNCIAASRKRNTQVAVNTATVPVYTSLR